MVGGDSQPASSESDHVIWQGTTLREAVPCDIQGMSFGMVMPGRRKYSQVLPSGFVEVSWISAYERRALVAWTEIEHDWCAVDDPAPFSASFGLQDQIREIDRSESDGTGDAVEADLSACCSEARWKAAADRP